MTWVVQRLHVQPPNNNLSAILVGRRLGMKAIETVVKVNRNKNIKTKRNYLQTFFKKSINELRNPGGDGHQHRVTRKG